MVTISDVEAKAREIQVAVTETTEAARNTAVLAAVAVVVAVGLSYLLGKRRGRSRSAIIEIRRS